jgi:hypothetical protein
MESATTKKMTVDEFSRLIQNRRDLYEAVIRNGYYLPRFKTTVITEDYMRNVITGKAFCPKYDEIKMLPCPRPPTKQILLDKFHAICQEQNLVHVGVDEKHVPDKRWLLDFVSTFKADDEIFKKNYIPPAKETKLSELKTIELPAAFLDDLPQSTRRSRRKGLRISKEGLAGQKLERFKRLRKELGNRILREEERKDGRESRKRDSRRSATNESNFKPPGTTTPPRTHRGGNNASASSQKPGSQNISLMQPQSQASPSIAQRMQGISLSLNNKP